ncbi:MAG: endonuclease VIII [Myxococcales bacterium]|nr:endonuclease VIII [Myxococcales bacterium]
MPERPDLEYVVPRLHEEVVGRTIEGAEVLNPVVMRLAVQGAANELLSGRRIEDVTRRAHFVRLALKTTKKQRAAGAAGEIIVSPMLAGRFEIKDKGQKRRADVALVLALDDGRELRYRDDRQMGKVYVIARDDHDKVPGFSAEGVDVLGEAFTRERFRELAAKRRDQVRVFLMDKAAIDSLGNAYADEVLFAAGIHPKTFVRKLSPEQIDMLHDAIVEVIDSACKEIARRAPPLDEKVRDFLKVRRRHGDPCPRCGAKIRRAGVRGYDAYFCPSCQPDGRGSSIVDWRKTQR